MQAIVENHLALEGEMLKWGEIRGHLKDETHEKKCVRVPFGEQESFLYPEYTLPPNSELDRMYDAALMFGEKQIYGGTWAPRIRQHLERQIANEVRKHQGSLTRKELFYYTDIHCAFGEYNSHHAEHEARSKFDKTEWVLDKGLELTQHDREVFARFMTDVLDCANRIVAVLDRRTTYDSWFVPDKNEYYFVFMELRRIGWAFDDVSDLIPGHTLPTVNKPLPFNDEEDDSYSCDSCSDDDGAAMSI